jgi:hypothetical protein
MVKLCISPNINGEICMCHCIPRIPRVFRAYSAYSGIPRIPEPLERCGAGERGLVFGAEPQFDAALIGERAGRGNLLKLVVDSL